MLGGVFLINKSHSHLIYVGFVDNVIKSSYYEVVERVYVLALLRQLRVNVLDRN